MALSLIGLGACNIYLKDMVDGSPYERSYDEAYKQAIAEGMSHGSAHRRALLAGGSNYNEVWKARREKEREDEEWDEFMGADSSDDVKLRWD
ncbi:hypothetical protein HZ994_12835 [Akkermansiaceae bacterium]|nr:hypothetical protein HZ994_12835 [Akkermansiaceae bacterium]